MPTHPFIICLFVLASLVCGSALAADKPSTQADFEKLQDQVRTLDKELAVQKEAFIRKLDDVEKRQADNTAKDANSLAAISNQTTTLGNYITAAGILVTLGLVFLGLFTFSKAKEAVSDAKKASMEWLEGYRPELQLKLNEVRQSMVDQLNNARESMAAAADEKMTASLLEFDKKIDDATKRVTKTANETCEQILRKPFSQLAITENYKEKLQREIIPLKNKPEKSFTSGDYFKKGLSLYAEKNFQSALDAFYSASISLAGTDPVILRAEYLFAQSRALAALKNEVKTIEIYDQIFDKFSKKKTPRFATM